jgi:hypothetical protein
MSAAGPEAAEEELNPLFWVSVLQGITVELRRPRANHANKKTTTRSIIIQLYLLK